MQPSLLWSWNRTIDRLPYLLAGVILFLIKFSIDWTIATRLFGQSWSLAHYLIWPNERTLRVFDLTDPDRRFAVTMLGVSLPFIWAGVMLTLHRLRAAGLPLWLVAFFFVPLINLLLFLLLVLVPNAPPRTEPATLQPSAPAFGRLRQTHRQLAGDSYWRSAAFSWAITVPLTVGGVILSAMSLGSYGFGLFVGAPFALGMCSVLLFGLSKPQSFGRCVQVAMLATLFAGMAILLFALEGFICLIMAAPIAFLLSFLGSVVGYAIQSRPWMSGQTATYMLALVLALPALMAAESASEPVPDVRVVVTEVIIDAPPEKVWLHVIDFTDLPEPEEWLFQAGIAYPIRAKIHGSGVGAIRHCVFSTGTFVEPIEVWDPPTLLHFRVTEQPEPMHEWSPYHIHPPHLQNYLISHRGQFLLEALPDGRTRLEGTTWYTNRMWPAAYWNLWSDGIIHRIHGRVLRHIQRLADTGS